MIESLIIQEIIAERTRETLIDFLVARFGAEALALDTELKAIDDEGRLKELVRLAATCRSLNAFRKQLSART